MEKRIEEYNVTKRVRCTDLTCPRVLKGKLGDITHRPTGGDCDSCYNFEKANISILTKHIYPDCFRKFKKFTQLPIFFGYTREDCECSFWDECIKDE